MSSENASRFRRITRLEYVVATIDKLKPFLDKERPINLITNRIKQVEYLRCLGTQHLSVVGHLLPATASGTTADSSWQVILQLADFWDSTNGVVANQ
ncbi:hypothetical protein [Oryzomonas rubra]|uniref:hypothetical protein n=1 Tax=Oryzomonas rubra TaxID=2509454 RepID=UPI00165DF300|nr:hypothetical protein [Oryzomonas rubra]